MRTAARTIITMLVWIAPALAAVEADPGEGGMLLNLFLGFGAVILVFQLLPSLILFASMIKGLVARPAKETMATAEKQDK